MGILGILRDTSIIYLIDSFESSIHNSSRKLNIQVKECSFSFYSDDMMESNLFFTWRNIYKLHKCPNTPTSLTNHIINQCANFMEHCIYIFRFPGYIVNINNRSGESNLETIKKQSSESVELHKHIPNDLPLRTRYNTANSISTLTLITSSVFVFQSNIPCQKVRFYFKV